MKALQIPQDQEGSAWDQTSGKTSATPGLTSHMVIPLQMTHANIIKALRADKPGFILYL